MRKIKFLILSFLTLGMTACFYQEDHGKAPDVPITFDPVVMANTRAEGEASRQDEPFRVWVSSDKQMIMNGEEIALRDSVWAAEKTFLWPEKTTLNCFAVSPSHLDASFSQDKGLSIKNLDATAIHIIPCFTYAIEDQEMEASKGCIAIPFVRCFSKVSVALRSFAHKDSSIVLKALYIDSIAYKGDFHSLPQPAWDYSEDRMRLDIFQGAMSVEVNARELSPLMVMGQSIDKPIVAVIDVYDKDFELVIADKILYTSPLNVIWKAGRYYDYTLNINTGSLKLATDVIKQR